MFSLYIPAMVLMVVFALQDLKNQKEKTEKKHPGVDRKKIGGLDEPEKLRINRLTGILIGGVGFLGCCSHKV